MKTINRKRAEIVMNHPMIQTDGNCATTISFIISKLLPDCPSYNESMSCTEDCPTTNDSFSVLKLSSVLNANFGNVLDAIWENFPSKICARCGEPALMEIQFAPILFIEVHTHS